MESILSLTGKISLSIQNYYHQQHIDTFNYDEVLEDKIYNALECEVPRGMFRSILKHCFTPTDQFNISSPFTNLCPDVSWLHKNNDTFFPLLYEYEFSPEQFDSWTRKRKEVALIPQNKQRSQEWLDQRKLYLTASQIGPVMGEGSGSVRDILLGKCTDTRTFKGNKYTEHGNIFEPLAVMVYEKMYRTKIYDYGCIPHGCIPSHSEKKIPFIAASPDGISEKGVMLEIKCPYSRNPVRYNGKVHGETNGKKCIIPKGYYSQMQTQMSCCDLDVCDFMECVFKYIPDKETFLTESAKYYCGVILRYQDLKSGKYVYEYPDKLYTDAKGYFKWVRGFMDRKSEEFPRKYAFSKILYWKLEDVFIFRTRRDRQFIPLKMDKLTEFWDKVQRAKADKEFLGTIIPSKKKKEIKGTSLGIKGTSLDVCQI